MKLKAIAAAALIVAASTTAPRAELSEITVAQQFGVAFLPLMLMERDQLIEKHAKAAGVDVKTNWQKVAGPSVINDGLLSGNVTGDVVVADQNQCRRQGRGRDDVLSALFRDAQSGPEIAEGPLAKRQDRSTVSEDFDSGADAADVSVRSVRTHQLSEVRRIDRLAGASRCHGGADEQHERRERALRHVAVLRAGDEAPGRAGAHDQL
jgi:hypothetical protein